MRKLPSVGLTPGTIFLKGGLDIITPPMLIDPGKIIAVSNYQADRLGGYTRIDGYERYDGKPSPSEQTYLYCPVEYSGVLEVGDTITGLVNGSTGIVICVSSDHMAITETSGLWQAEAFSVDGVTVGTITSTPLENGEPTAYRQAVSLSATADLYREDINSVPGSGPIRGISIYKGDIYAFRDNVGATAGTIHKATPVGWGEIDLYNELSFDAGVSEILEGSTIVQDVSGASATVKRVVVVTGAWSTSDASGKLIISDITGAFNATNILKVLTVTKATSTSLSSAIAILPGGRYETVNYNFFGGPTTRRIYGCDGVNRAFEFDGSVYVPIDTNTIIDTPSHVSAWKKHLFLSFNSIIRNSSLGEPLVFEALTGATEFGIGDDVTGMLVQPGDVLAIFARNSTHQMVGTTVADFVLSVISADVGNIEWTHQNIGSAYCLDDRGVIRIHPTDAYGNFSQRTISQQIQPLINELKNKAIASTTYKSDDQYRIYGNDGSGIILTLAAGKKGYYFSRFKYPVNMTYAVSGEASDGTDIVFLGDEDGFVYQARKGSSFDGKSIESFIRPAYNHFKSPSIRKRFRNGYLEMSAVGYASISVSPDFSYSDPVISRHGSTEIENNGTGGFWDIDNWESFYYDSQIYSNPRFGVDGVGENVGLIFYSNSKIDLGHTLNGITINYTPLRIRR